MENYSEISEFEDANQVDNFTNGKLWRFSEIKRGDCTIHDGATFTLNSNGSGVWECDISSSDSGDEWDGEFSFLSKQNSLLFKIGGFHFDISDPHQKKRWRQEVPPDGTRSQFFNDAHFLSFSCSC